MPYGMAFLRNAREAVVSLPYTLHRSASLIVGDGDHTVPKPILPPHRQRCRVRAAAKRRRRRTRPPNPIPHPHRRSGPVRTIETRRIARPPHPVCESNSHCGPKYNTSVNICQLPRIFVDKYSHLWYNTGTNKTNWGQKHAYR